MNERNSDMKKLLSILLITIFSATVFLGCDQNPSQEQTSSSPSESFSYTFTDALGREVTIDSADRIGIASGSFVECFLLAGGVPVAVTQDAWKERDLDLPAEVIDMGSLVHPSTEVILEADLDLLVLVSTVKTHLELGETLDKTDIPYAYLNIETFEDYLNVLKIFTDITGQADLYEQNGTQIAAQIDNIIEESKLENSPKVLVLRSSSSKITARNSETMVGQMLKNLGCINIADHEDSLLEDLSLEVIAQKNPEYIFVICRGNLEEAQANLENMLASNPIWSTLDAVKNNNLYYLDKELFHYKPTVRWGESYEILANIFAGN